MKEKKTATLDQAESIYSMWLVFREAFSYVFVLSPEIYCNKVNILYLRSHLSHSTAAPVFLTSHSETLIKTYCRGKGNTSDNRMHVICKQVPYTVPIGSILAQYLTLFNTQIQFPWICFFTISLWRSYNFSK